MRNIKFIARRFRIMKWVSIDPYIGFNEYIHCEYPIDKKTISQFTGIKKDNILFFENQIVEHDGEVGFIVFELGSFVIKLKNECFVPSYNWHVETMKVIGNIFDNPELLK